MLEQAGILKLRLTDDKCQRINAGSSKGICENKDLENDVIGCHGLGYSCE
jgi:hypothetical protein